MAYTGWIFAEKSDKAFLELLGVKVGPHVGDEFTHCFVSDKAMDRLDPHFGQFVWGFEEASQ